MTVPEGPATRLEEPDPQGTRRGRHRVPRKGSWRWVVVTALLAYLAVATFHTDFRPIAPGLDPSWGYAINRIPYIEALYGRDVVFTFGPLGYLLGGPRDLGSNLPQAAILWITAQTLLVGAAVSAFLRHRQALAVVGFVVTWLLAASTGLLFEHGLLLLVGLLLALPPDELWVWRVSTATASTLAAVLSFAKVSSALIALAMLVAVATVRIARREVPARQVFAWCVLPLALVGGILTMTLLDGPANLVRWAGASMEFVGGYPTAMSIPSPISVTVPVLFSVGVGIGAMLTVARREPRMLAGALPLVLLILIALRHSVVRHHGRFVPAIVLGSMAVLMLLGPSRRRMAVLAVASIVALASFVWISFVPACFCQWSIERLGPGQGASGIGELIRFGETTRKLAAESEDRLAADRLPAEWVDLIGKNSVDVIPWEIAFAPANGLPWQPNPTLQTYGAFTPRLDDWAARHFDGPRGPEFLLLQFVEIDARHPMLGAPSMWRSLLSWYEPVPLSPVIGPFGEVALFRRRSEPVALRLDEAGRTEGRIGEWVSIPDSPDLMFASIRLRPDTGGRLAGLVWRIDPVYLDLQLPDGGVLTMRIVPTTVEDGLLLNHLPMTLDELLDFMKGTGARELVGFRVHGPGTGSYQANFDVQWQTAPWTP